MNTAEEFRRILASGLESVQDFEEVYEWARLCRFSGKSLEEVTGLAIMEFFENRAVGGVLKNSRDLGDIGFLLDRIQFAFVREEEDSLDAMRLEIESFGHRLESSIVKVDGREFEKIAAHPPFVPAGEELTVQFKHPQSRFANVRDERAALELLLHRVKMEHGIGVGG